MHVEKDMPTRMFHTPVSFCYTLPWLCFLWQYSAQQKKKNKAIPTNTAKRISLPTKKNSICLSFAELFAAGIKALCIQFMCELSMKLILQSVQWPPEKSLLLEMYQKLPQGTQFFKIFHILHSHSQGCHHGNQIVPHLLYDFLILLFLNLKTQSYNYFNNLIRDLL